ncbi:putative TauD/TfdA-like domain-containing protein [Seiridium unicorne]|uniref:TauD/TfdA-like domain-containing protein n=1 Tax=Seiridium unicorne TaxID=138068 RepID=A0ABR2UZE1_9PEZI
MSIATLSATAEVPVVQKADTADSVYLDASHTKTAARILAIINRYALSKEGGDNGTAERTTKFLDQIYSKVADAQPILLCLPAFPFKSPNTSAKVLGRLPDKAEEFALAHLNGLCCAIEDVYAPGAKLMIISDGLVYNDLLGVADSDVWAYGEALRAISSRNGLKHIEFSRLQDLVHIAVPNELDQIVYVSNATNFRHALLSRFSNPDFDASLRIRNDEDTCMTYRGYIKFLSTDLQDVYPVGQARTKSQFKRGIEYVAKQMLFRGDAFARAVKETFADRLRLSIHPSTGENKISISPLPTDTFFTTPWHCTVAFRLDGTVTSGHHAVFDADDNFELVCQDGRPSFYREKTDLLSWASERGGITCEPLYPAGLLVRPANGAGALSIEDIDGAKVRALAEHNSPVILRDFSKTRDRDLFVKKSHDLGAPIGWKFGLVLEVKDRGADTRGLNNVLSAEWMPFHYDGLFMTEKRTKEDGSEEIVSTPPRYTTFATEYICVSANFDVRFQFFTSVTTSPKDTGFTLFSSSTLMFKYLPREHQLEYLRKLTWTVSTSSFGATVLRGLPLVVSHPETGRPCIRFHEPWPQSKTSFEATNVEIDNAGETSESTTICDTLTDLLHDRRIAYYHAWEKGDLLVSDNVLAMHTRSDFTAGCDRELWRINFN